MKQETKDLIKWFQQFLIDFEGTYNEKIPDGYDKKMFELLDSLPALEEQLKHGGFLPDINNTPCKDGDLIKIVKPDRSGNHFPEFAEGEIYKLYWDFPSHEFSFMNTNTGDLYFFSCDDKFEKFRA